MLDFSFQDILGSWVALFIFPFVLLFPGYVICWTFDLFDFKQRRLLTRYNIALIVSIAVVPILVYLLAFLTSFYVTDLILAFFFITYIIILLIESSKFQEHHGPPFVLSRIQKLGFMIAILWVSFCILSLIDIQWGNRLYNSAVSLDFATRVTVINAITRTGVPPVNPSYFPGHPEYITSLYYFWYILCSIVDQLGGNLVDARTALIAGDAWCGLILMALIAFYLKLRNRNSSDKAWKMAIFGIGLLSISGLDVIPASLSMIATRLSLGFMWPPGDIEQWNEQITAWVGSLFWVPHHVAGMIACLVAFMLIQHHRQITDARKFPAAIFAGLALASAVGLSVWVTIVFSVFWVIWIVILIFQKNNWGIVFVMMIAGFVALITASPFLLGVLKAGSGASGPPLVLAVRRFFLVTQYVGSFSIIAKNIIYFIFLPINYLFELGFFLIVGLMWLSKYHNKEIANNSYIFPEIILLCVVVLICSFFRAAIVANDLGWRGWLFGQFLLLVWAVDINEVHPFFPDYQHLKKAKFISPKNILKKVLIILMLVGVFTSVVDVAVLRFWPILIDMKIAGFPNGLSPDTQLGRRTYAARLAYEFIRDELASNAVIQPNPLNDIDRPSGLYGTRQIAISANAPYNVPSPVLIRNTNQISKIFVHRNVRTWEKIDELCKEYFIDVIVLNDLDPVWKHLLVLEKERKPLYQNDFYSVVQCGVNFKP
jgi:hypothetical protein